MCCIYYSEKFEWSHWAILDRMARHNPHGFGFAVYEPGFGWKVKRTLNFNKSGFMEYMVSAIGKSAIFHCRIATVGSVTIKNCQPFHLNQNDIFCHNGTVPAFRVVGSTDSDSKRIAEILFLKQEGRSEYVKKLGAQYPYSRFLYASPEGRVVLSGLGWRKLRLKDGSSFWCSNENWRQIWTK